MKNKLNRTRFIKFCVVGFIGTLINYLVYKVIGIALPNDFAWSCGILAGASLNYVLNEMFTFNTDNKLGGGTSG